MHLPVTWSAGDHVETVIVAPLLLASLVAASLGVLGVWPLLFHVLTSGGA